MAKRSRTGRITTPPPKSRRVDAGPGTAALARGTNDRLIVDFSSSSAWRSCSRGDFSSYLYDEKEFVELFRDAMMLVQTLSKYSLDLLIGTHSQFRHCHPLYAEREKRAHAILTEVLLVPEQEIEGEKLIQLGEGGGLRLIGTARGNIFRAYLMDYHHELYKNETQNRSKKAQDKFCPINGRK